ncbi:MAG TPA: hypothetical protein VE033_12060 [Acetobacteraceae bacterium]|nr:hypothetical protein [Acetobacteraceae bacterium]
MPDVNLAPGAQLLQAERRPLSPALAEAGVFLLILAVVALLRLPSFAPAVVDTDEGLYMVQAREWLRGGWPLVAAWDMHPIGAPALYALAFLVFGEGVEAARLLGLIFIALTAYALHWCARVAGAGRGVGIGAGLIYAGHTLYLGGLCTNTELLLAPFVAGAMAIGIAGTVQATGPGARAPGWGAVIAMGALVGPALVIKQVVVPEGSLAFALLVGPALARGLLPWRRGLAMAAAYAALCAAPFVLVGVVYWSQGWLEDFLDSSVLAPFNYAMEGVGAAEAMRRVATAGLTLAWAFVAAIVAVVAWRPDLRSGPVGVLTGIGLLWFLVASFAVAAPGFYFAHYFLLWLPPLSLLAALGLWQLAGHMSLMRPRLLYMLLAGMLAANPLLAEAARLFDRGPGVVHRDPVREVAAAMRAALGPGEAAFVANYHPTVYVLSGAALATRFPFPAHVTGPFAQLAGTDTDHELERVLASRPRVIVVDRGWMHTMRPDATNQVEAALRAGYRLFATVGEVRGPVEVWRLE